MIKKLQALKAKKGFTLVELIVVIAIIGVLAAILVPTMMNVVTKARVSSADQTAKSIADSATQWLSDLEANRGTIPDSYLTVSIKKLDKADADGHMIEATITYADATKSPYKRNGSDSKGDLAKTLLADDLETNYPFKGGETFIIYTKAKHVLGVAYSDDGAIKVDDFAKTFPSTDFDAQTHTWDSASKEGIDDSNNIIGTNPKLLHVAKSTPTT